MLFQKTILCIFFILPSFVFGADDLSVQYFKRPENVSVRFMEMHPTEIQEHTSHIIFVPGMGGMLEEYIHVGKRLAEEGHYVWMLEWRGQGGSSRISDRIHVDSFDEYIDDLAAFIESKIPSEKVGIFALSMGAHVSLRYASESPKRVAYVSAISPLVRMRTPFPFWMSRILTEIACAIGWQNNFALGQMPYDLGRATEHLINDCQLPEGELARYQRTILSNPEHTPGGVTWGWVLAAMRSLDMLLASEIPVPVQTFETPRDHRVDVTSYDELMISDVERRRLDAPHDMFYGGATIVDEVMRQFREFREGLAKAI